MYTTFFFLIIQIKFPLCHIIHKSGTWLDRTLCYLTELSVHAKRNFAEKYGKTLNVQCTHIKFYFNVILAFCILGELQTNSSITCIFFLTILITKMCLVLVTNFTTLKGFLIQGIPFLITMEISFRRRITIMIKIEEAVQRAMEMDGGSMHVTTLI